MTEFSKNAGLNNVYMYTNHLCRATTVHVNDAAQVPSHHIMTVTARKSESSLKTYNEIDKENKQMMSLKETKEKQKFIG